MKKPRKVNLRNEGVATRRGGHMEYALAHTPTPSIPYLIYLLSNLSHILSIPYLIVSILSHPAVDYIRLYVM
jgi:hypothetical protein